MATKPTPSPAPASTTTTTVTNRATEDDAASPLIEVRLSLDVKRRSSDKGAIRANLEFINRASRPVQLVQFVAGIDNHDPDNQYFAIRAADGSEIDYEGMMKKRAPPDAEDFIELPPGGSVKGWFELHDQYAFPAKPAQYQVWYEHTNHFSRDDVTLKSNIVELEY